jgi:hypothetical protein
MIMCDTANCRVDGPRVDWE